MKKTYAIAAMIISKLVTYTVSIAKNCWGSSDWNGRRDLHVDDFGTILADNSGLIEAIQNSYGCVLYQMLANDYIAYCEKANLEICVRTLENFDYQFKMDYRYQNNCIKYPQINCLSEEATRYIHVGKSLLAYDNLRKYDKVIITPADNVVANVSKALSVLKDGGKLACVMDVDELKKPTPAHKAMLNTFIKYDADVEVVEGKAIVTLTKTAAPAAPVSCIALDKFNYSGIDTSTEAGMVAKYRVEVNAAELIYEQMHAFNRETNSNYFGYLHYNSSDESSDIRQDHNKRWWYKLYNLLTHKVKPALSCYNRERLDRVLHNYTAKYDAEFCEYTIKQFKWDIAEVIDNAFAKDAEAVFDALTTYDDEKKLLPKIKGSRYERQLKHSTNGKGSNYVVMIGERYSKRRSLGDIIRVLSQLKNGESISDVEVKDWDTINVRSEHNGTITTPYFTLKAYKNGKANITFTDLDVLAKLNDYISDLRGWKTNA